MGGVFRTRDAMVKADPRAFGEFMADRQDEPPQIRADGEGTATLEAIDEGIADAKADRMIPAKEARKKLRKWICESRK